MTTTLELARTAVFQLGLLLGLALCLGLANAPPATAGVFADGLSDVVTVGAGVRSWAIDDATGSKIDVSQTALPIRLRMPIQNRDIMLLVETSGTFTDLSGSVDGSLGSATDTRLEATYLLPDDRFFVSGGFNLPTGPTKLDEQQLNVARVVSNEILGFSTRSYGAGFDVFLSASGAVPLSDELSAGGSLRFRVNGAFDFGTGDGGTLRGRIGPGDEFSLSGGGSYKTDTERKRGADQRVLSANLDATARFFTTDSVDGNDVFKQGKELELFGNAGLREERRHSGVFMRLMLVEDSSFKGGATPLDLEDDLLNLILANVSGNRFEVGGAATYGVTPVVHLGGLIAFRYFAEARATVPASTDEPLFFIRQSARTLEIGPTLSWDRTRALRIGARAVYLTGSALGGDANMSGYDLGASVTYQF